MKWVIRYTGKDGKEKESPPFNHEDSARLMLISVQSLMFIQSSRVCQIEEDKK